jgi:hypothetical protein
VKNSSETASFEMVSTRGFAAAVLQAWGCPRAAGHRRAIRLPDRFSDLGLAVLVGVGVATDGMGHVLTCWSAEGLPPIQPQDLLVLSEWHCVGSISRIGLAAQGSAAFRQQLRLLVVSLDHAFSDFPPARAPGVEAEVRAIRLGLALRRATDQFLDNATAGPALTGLIERGRAWIDKCVSENRQSLRRDGLHRLRLQLESEMAASDRAGGLRPGQSRTAAVARAEAAVADTASGQVVCMFPSLSRVADCALTAAETSAERSFGARPSQTKAVAVLPRDVVVLLHAYGETQLGPDGDHVIVHAEAVDPAWGNLSHLCQIALELWADGGCSAVMAWQAAASAAR